MATKEEIQQLLDAIKGALSAKFDENDKRFTTLINGLQTQWCIQKPYLHSKSNFSYNICSFFNYSEKQDSIAHGRFHIGAYYFFPACLLDENKSTKES